MRCRPRTWRGQSSSYRVRASRRKFRTDSNTRSLFLHGGTMGSANVSQALRPLRVGFLVNPTEPAAVLQAIELTSTLWGGMFNPIIPLYAHRLPKIWARHGF